MSEKFNIDKSLYDIINEYPQCKEILVNAGLENINNPLLLKSMGKHISLRKALETKGINIQIITTELEEILNNSSENKNLVNIQDNDLIKNIDNIISVDGVLACPIRIPLQDAFESFVNSENIDFKVTHNLKSANMGVGDIEALCHKNDINEMPDIILSAGFELFFDKTLMGQFFDKGSFAVNLPKMNKDFQNNQLSLVDPKGQYGIIGVVPAVFIVDKKLLGDREIPTSWEMLLSDVYKDSIAIPMKDLDLFNAIIINIYKNFGMDGVKKLADNYFDSVHPSQMVKSSGAAISVCPYFFTTMLNPNGSQIPVWPSDGAIISPIFLVAKKGKENVSKLVDFFLSHEAGQILSGNGKFPATRYDVDNHLSKNQGFSWLGWDYIYSHDIANEIREAERVFQDEVSKKRLFNC